MTIETPHPDRGSGPEDASTADLDMSTAQSAAQRAVQSTAAANGDMVRLVHDLRQPLGVLIGYINLLLDHPGEFGDDDRTAMLGEMRTAAARLDGMLHGMVASDDEMP
jgi:signal transduction histidine kinase